MMLTPPKRSVCTGQIMTSKNEPELTVYSPTIVPSSFRDGLLNGREQVLRALNLIPVGAVIVVVMAWFFFKLWSLIFGGIVLLIYPIARMYMNRSISVIRDGQITAYRCTVEGKDIYGEAREINEYTHYLVIGGSYMQVSGAEYNEYDIGDELEVAVAELDGRRVFCGIVK